MKNVYKINIWKDFDIREKFEKFVIVRFFIGSIFLKKV